MLEIGIRELKSRLSYYVQLMQSGETIAIKVRERVVGFLSREKHQISQAKKTKHSGIVKLIHRLKREGRLLGGVAYRPGAFKPIQMKPGPTITTLIRKMRDEEM